MEDQENHGAAEDLLEVKFSSKKKQEDVRTTSNEETRQNITVKFIRAWIAHFRQLVHILILPKSERNTTSSGNSELKIPFLMSLLSFVQLLVYVNVYDNSWLWSALIFDPRKRHEIWRFLTVMLLHGDLWHLWGNLLTQLVLGSLLETIHNWKRLGCVYLLGVIAGTLTSSVIDRFRCIGASGGVSALFGAHFALTILNWGEMGYEIIRITCLAIAFVFFDNYLNILFSFPVVHAGHVGGILAGFLLGIIVLKRFRVRIKWDRIMRIGCVILSAFLFVLMVIANVFVHFEDRDNYRRTHNESVAFLE